MNPLERYFVSGRGRKVHKLAHYLDIYHHHFRKYRGKPVVLIEIGVNYDGGLQMYRNYFGATARIIGVDVLEDSGRFAGPGFEFFCGDQGDQEFWKRVKAQIPRPDIVIDDGSHWPSHQRTSFESLFSFRCRRWPLSRRRLPFQLSQSLQCRPSQPDQLHRIRKIANR